MHDDFLVCKSAPKWKKQYVGPFSTPRLDELRQMVEEAPRFESDGLTFKHIPAPSGVQTLIKDPAYAGAVFQVASQFNCLEMVGPGVSPSRGITGYVSDPTQGPACALACPAASVFRNYFSLDGEGQGRRQIDCLYDVGQVLGNANGSLWEMKNVSNWLTHCQ